MVLLVPLEIFLLYNHKRFEHGLLKRYLPKSLYPNFAYPHEFLAGRHSLYKISFADSVSGLPDSILYAKATLLRNIKTHLQKLWKALSFPLCEDMHST